MTSAHAQVLAFHFQVRYGAADVTCVVTQDACEALGIVDTGHSERHRRFLEGIALERLEWSSVPQSTIIIDAWDIATHRPD